ncbi:MAG TPA: MFS transporter [Nocardioidaceae bacterium]|nr:MFS transporter [Nocardioidaceae bacterium]
MAAPTATAADVQRRTVANLVASQALGGVGVSTGIAVIVLLAEDILGSAGLAGLPQSAQVFGSAAGAYGIAALSQRAGRRIGLAAGYATGASGAVLCVLAAVVSSFALLMIGAALLGCATAANSQARFAATDLAPATGRARALSIVVWATTIGAVLGPNLVGLAGNGAAAVGLPELAGALVLAGLGTGLAAGFLQWRLRPDPLLLSRELADGDADGDPGAPRPHVLTVLREHPRAIAGMVAVAAGHVTMVSVMVMTPLHMDHGGADLELVGFVISIHVLGMFAFAPLVGWYTDRAGQRVVLLTGAAILLAAVTLAGRSPEGASGSLVAGLFLLGLGWSCTLVAGSTMLTEAVPLPDRPTVQGTSDLVMGVCAGIGGAAGGWVVATWGFNILNVAAGFVALAVVVVAVVVRRMVTEPVGA